MDDVLNTLQEKEKELRAQLEQTPIFIQWESLKRTISLFENGQSANGGGKKKLVPPSVYTNELTWNEKLLYVINARQNAFIADIISDLKRLGQQGTDDFLQKRVSTIASALKTRKVLGSKTVGGKEKYFIR